MIDTHGLELSAEELQKRNLSLKRDRESGMESDAFAEKLIPTLQDEKGVRVVTVWKESFICSTTTKIFF